jgi:hemolysin activation/secretion protein
LLKAGVVASLSLLLPSNLALAQQPPNAGSTLKDLKNLHGPARPAKPDPTVEVTPPASPPGKEDTALTLKVRAFRIVGNTVYSEKELRALLNMAEGRDLTLADLQQATGTITAHYRRNGYLLARAYLPVQEIQQGVVVIAVVEGRVGRVLPEFGPGLRLSESSARRYLAAIPPGRPLRESTLERPLLVLNDVPGVTVKATLSPGEKVGESDVQVHIDRDGRLLSGAVQFDNWGNRFLGQYRLTPTLVLTSPTGIGDQLLLQGTISERRGLLFGRFFYDAPAGHLGTRVGVGYAHLAYTLGEDFEILDAHGTAQVGTLSVSHPFIRSRRLSLYAQSGVEYKALEDRIDVIGSALEKSAVAWSAAVSGEVRDRWAGGGVNTFMLGYTLGDLSLRSPDAEAQDAPPSGPDTEGLYQKVNYRLTRLQRVVESLFFHLSASGQYAVKNLDASEKFVLGGPEGVRAYPIGELPADIANLATAELRWSPPLPWIPGHAGGFLFADAGWAQINKEPFAGLGGEDNRQQLVAYGGGLTWALADRVSAGATIAWHGHEDPTSDVDRSPRIWAAVQTRF